MNRKQYKVAISAPAGKVWDMLWSDAGYREWTTAFTEGSHAVSDWKKGSKVLFMDAKGSGMIAVIEDIVPNQFMSFKHLGEIKDGVEDTTSDKVKEWAGAHENYTLTEDNGQTTVTVDMDIAEPFAEMFDKIWPKALAKLKEISER